MPFLFTLGSLQRLSVFAYKVDTANALSPHPMPSKEGILPQGAPGQGKDTVHMVRYDTSKAQRILGIAPKGMEETTRDTLADYESRGW